jgi:hypothetical protein
MARYSPDGQPSSWSRCEVVNVSEGGAGLILSGPQVETGTSLTLELEMNDRDPLGGQVQGTVKHVSMTPDGTMHIGIEFAPDQAALVVLKITRELAPVLDAV